MPEGSLHRYVIIRTGPRHWMLPCNHANIIYYVGRAAHGLILQFGLDEQERVMMGEEFGPSLNVFSVAASNHRIESALVQLPQMPHVVS